MTRETLASDPDNAWARFRVGTAELARGDPAGGSRLLSLARNPSGQRKSAAALAAHYRRRGDSESATGFEYFTSLLSQDQPWPNPFEDELANAQRGERALIELESRQGGARDFAGSLASARKLAERYPSARTKLIQGRALVQSGDPDAAVLILHDAVAGEPDLTIAHVFLGVGRFEIAERLEGSGRTAEARATYTEALTALDRAVALTSDYAPGYYYRSQALTKLGRPADALAAIRDFLARRPEEWQGYLIEADLLAAAGKKDEAIRAAERAVKLVNRAEPRPKAALARLKGMESK